MSMIRTSISRRTSDGSSAAAACEIIAGAKGFYLRELMISLAAATTSIYGLGFPAAKGITPTSPVTSLLERPSNSAPATTSALAWGTGPTVPAQFFRRIGFPATIGSWIRFKWDTSSGIYVASGLSLVLWNLAANGVVDVSVSVDEPV